MPTTRQLCPAQVPTRCSIKPIAPRRAPRRLTAAIAASARARAATLDLQPGACEPCRSARWVTASRRKVMVVEDDEEVAGPIARKLGRDGSRGRGRRASRAPVLARLDAGAATGTSCMLDVGLPGMSGLDVLAPVPRGRLAGVDHHADRRSTARDRDECMRAGAFYYLTKPFEPFQLSSMVQSAARYSRLRRQLAAARRAPRRRPDAGRQRRAAMRRLRAALERLGEPGRLDPDPGRERHRQGAGRARAARARRAAPQAGSSRSTAARFPSR